MPDENKQPVPNKAPFFMTPELVKKLYDILGATPTQQRLIRKVVITLEAGQAVTITEETIPLQDMPGSPPQVPEAKPELNDNTETKGDA